MQKTTVSSKQKPTVRGVFTITRCLWFDRQAEDAAKFYVSLFPDSHIDKVVKSPADFPSGKKGDALVVDFTLTGRKFSGLNGGPYFKLNEAVSFIIPCENQAEGDRYWKALSAVPRSPQSGWGKGHHRLPWRHVAAVRNRVPADPAPPRGPGAVDD